MRFIIREQGFEKLLASGRLRYEREGQPTGTVEKWRLTAAAAGYRFLRVDLDAREAASGDSYLYHLAINPAGKPERLKFRFYGQQVQILGDVLLDQELVMASRNLNGRRVEDELKVESTYGFWFPSSVGIGLVTSAAGDELSIPSVVLEKGNEFAPRLVEVQLRWGEKESLAVNQQEIAVRPCTIGWDGQRRTVWLDDQGWPVRMVRADGLIAVEGAYIRY
jgi:hypothetical protein